MPSVTVKLSSYVLNKNLFHDQMNKQRTQGQASCHMVTPHAQVESNTLHRKTQRADTYLKSVCTFTIVLASAM